MPDIDLAKVLLDNDGIVPQDISLQLLTDLQSKNESMKGLLPGDLETLSEVMDFLPFGAGDPLITKGEAATWLGYIAMGGVDVIIGGNTVATMPAGKLLGGMGLFFGGTRTVDCGGAKTGGVIAAIRFDALEEMVEDTPQVAVRVYASIAIGELQNLQSRLGETKKDDDDGGKKGKGKKGKKGKKGRKMSVTAAAKAEVLYRSKAAAASKEKKKLKDKMDNLAKDEKKRKMQAKNEKLARKKLQNTISEQEGIIEEKEEEIEGLEEEIEEMKEEMKEVQKVKDALAQAKREIKELKRRLAEKGGNGSGIMEDVSKKSKGKNKDLNQQLLDALAELEKWKNHKCPTTGDGLDGDLMKELMTLRAKAGTDTSGSDGLNTISQSQYNLEKNKLNNELQEMKNKLLLANAARKELEDALNRIASLEELIKKLRLQVTTGSRRNAMSHRTIIERNNELEKMILKCGTNGIYLDERNKELMNSKNMTQCYFSSWLMESLKCRELEKMLGDGKEKWDNEMKRLKEMYEKMLLEMRTKYELQIITLTTNHESELQRLRQEMALLRTTTQSKYDTMRKNLLGKMEQQKTNYEQELKLLLEKIAMLEDKNRSLNTLLNDRNARIALLEKELQAALAALAESTERCIALEGTMSAALTRRRSELAITLQRLADVTVLFLHVSRRCRELDSAFGVLAPPGSHFGGNHGTNMKAPSMNSIYSPWTSSSGIGLPLTEEFFPMTQFPAPPRVGSPRNNTRRNPRNKNGGRKGIHMLRSRSVIQPQQLEQSQQSPNNFDSPQSLRPTTSVLSYRDGSVNIGGGGRFQGSGSHIGGIGGSGGSSGSSGNENTNLMSPRTRQKGFKSHLQHKRQHKTDRLKKGMLRGGSSSGKNSNNIEGFKPTKESINNNPNNNNDSYLTTNNPEDSLSTSMQTKSAVNPSNISNISTTLSTFTSDKELSLGGASFAGSIGRAEEDFGFRPGSSQIKPSHLTNSSTSNKFPNMTSEFRSESVVLQRNDPTSPKKIRTKQIRENKNQILQFLMSMPNDTSKPTSIVNLPSLDSSGWIRLSGCLPLIHPAWHHIVVVDSDLNTLNNLSNALTKIGYTVTSISNVIEASNIIVENLCDLVICSDRTIENGCSSLRRMMETKMFQQEIRRPLAPVVKSIDIQYTAISPRIDEPELDQQQSFSSPPSSSTTTGNGQYYKDVSWMTASRIGSNYVVRLPIDTEPQRAGLATTVAQVLGIVKLVGCSS